MSEGAVGEVSAIRDEIFSSLDELLAVLKNVASGALEQRLSLRYPESHPVGALARSINEMAAALEEARARSARYSQTLIERIETIERQQAAINELSTPIIEVWTGVLCLPIVGVLDSARATEMTSALLKAIVDRKAPLAIVDITGIEVMDTRTADHFIRMARSVGLLGAKCALSGIAPNIARTIVQMGVDLSGIDSYRSLRDALRQYVKSRAGKDSRKQSDEPTR